MHGAVGDGLGLEVAHGTGGPEGFGEFHPPDGSGQPLPVRSAAAGPLAPGVHSVTPSWLTGQHHRRCRWVSPLRALLSPPDPRCAAVTLTAVPVPSVRCRSDRRAAVAVPLVLGLALGSLLTGCPTARSPVAGPASVIAVSAGMSVATEPADHDRSVERLVAGARQSIDLALYQLADPTIERLLVAAHRRGVTVRVLLDRADHGAAVNQSALTTLRAGGVPARWAAADVLLHQKTLIVDRTVAAVMTGNLTADSQSTTRDFVVIDRNRTTVGAIESIFDHDWSGAPSGPGPAVAGLVWSPGSAGPLVALIDSARHTLVTENEEMDAPAIEASLEAAARRGVSVRVIMSADRRWDRAWADLRRAGVEVVIVPDVPDQLYIHAKAMVIDGTTAFVGSQNFSTASLDSNRELGVVTTDPAVVRSVAATLAADAALG